jgi:hypothetical protein
MNFPVQRIRREGERPSPCWSGDLVRQRLVDAFTIERRMPGQRFATIASSWPAQPLHEFTDMLHWDDARERVWQSWERAKGVYPYEVSLMEEALDWLRWLPIGERRCLASWALASARGLSVRAMLDKRHWSRTTFYRKLDQAAQAISDRLNAQGVVVRTFT